MTIRAFYTLDHELRLVGASPETLRLWGKSLAEIRGKYVIDVFPFMAGGEIHEALLEALRTFRPVNARTWSRYLKVDVTVEIYPVHEGLQVSFLADRSGA